MQELSALIIECLTIVIAGRLVGKTKDSASSVAPGSRHPGIKEQRIRKFKFSLDKIRNLLPIDPIRNHCLIGMYTDLF